MSRLGRIAWVALFVSGLVSSPVYAVDVEIAELDETLEAGELVEPRTGKEARAESEGEPLNLQACAALLALTPGTWVIVDDKELQRVPGWAEQGEREDEAFTGLLECARRIGLPPTRAEISESGIDVTVEPSKLPAQAPIRRARPPGSELPDRTTRIDELGGNGVWDDFVWYSRATPAAPAGQVPAPAPTPVADVTPIEPAPAMPEFSAHVDAWNVFRQMSFSLAPHGAPEPSAQPAPVPTPAPTPELPPSVANFLAKPLFNIFENMFAVRPPLLGSEPASLAPELAPEPVKFAFPDLKPVPAPVAQILAMPYRSNRVSEVAAEAPIPLATPSEPLKRQPVVFRRSRSADGAVAQAHALPEPASLALVGFALFALAATRGRS